jgi:LPS-assembly protein
MKDKNILIIFFVNLILLLVSKNLTYAETSLYELRGIKIFYEKNNELIIAEGDAHAKDQFGKEIFAQKIIYDKKKLIINTETNSIYLDNKGNKLFANNFSYDLNLKIINAKNNVQYLDNDGNVFNFTNLKYDENNEVGVGIALKAQLKDKSSIEGSEATFNNKTRILIVGKNNKKNIIDKFVDIFSKNSNIYTPCEKDKFSKTIKDDCPDWSLKTQKTIYDINKKMIYHYGSLMQIKNVPFFYTPYFSHPDPTVKRKSGFLPPSIKKFDNLGQTFKTPYFYAIDENKDLTFSPIYYFNENPIFLAEYRQQNLNSKFYIDTSFTEGYKRLNYVDKNGTTIPRSAGSRNHFFFNFLGNYDDLLFDKNDLEVNVQRISQKNYLKINQINTENIKQDVSSLKNNIILNSYENNKKLSLSASIFENINDENRNTRFQYNIPSIDFSNFFNKYDQYINIGNLLQIQNVGGDSNQGLLNNKIETTSEQKVLNVFIDGISNVFKTSINNINYYNQNINSQKENLNSDIFLTAAVENTYPLVKINENNEHTIIPKIFSKFTTGSTNKLAFQNKVLTYGDIYSLNRSNNSSTPETGASIGYGTEYNLINKNLLNEVYSKSNFSIGQIARLNNSDNTLDSSTISKSRSAFAGNANFYYDKLSKDNILKDDFNSNVYSVGYDFILSKNTKKILKNNINAKIDYMSNSIITNYYETHDIGNEHYIDLQYTKKLNNNLNFLFGGRKNIQDNFTENNFIESNYDSDCLKIGLNLSKTFYNNQEIKPSKSLTLSIIFKPFGNPISPNLSSFLN